MRKRLVVIGIVLAVIVAGLSIWKTQDSEDDKVVYVFSDSCGYCSSFKPTFDKVTTEFLSENSGWSVEKLDIFNDDELKRALQLGAEATPTVFIVRNGNVIDRLEGEVPENSFRKFLERNISGGN